MHKNAIETNKFLKIYCIFPESAVKYTNIPKHSQTKYKEEYKVKNKFFSTNNVALVGMLAALIVVLGISGLGIIKVPGIGITILHIPVIIGAIIAGPAVGGMVGLLFGLWSIIDKVMYPTATGFVFFNPLVSVLPRVLLGLVAYYAYVWLKKALSKGVAISVTSLIATFFHTVSVLGMIYVVYAEKYMAVLNQPKEYAIVFLSGVAAKNGVAEAIASAILVPLVVLGIDRFQKK